MPDPRWQPPEPDADVAMVPVREVLSWLAATIAGPVGDYTAGACFGPWTVLRSAADVMLEAWDQRAER